MTLGRKLGIGPPGIALITLCLVACSPPPAQPPTASAQSLEDIGNRNQDAALKAASEQRARTRAEADIRAADGWDASRRSALEEETGHGSAINNGQPRAANPDDE